MVIRFVLLFAHGGVLPKHIDFGVEKINRDVRAWMAGAGSEEIVPVVMAEDSPVWTRLYSEPEASDDACSVLQTALERLEARRMVVGHTVQKDGITSACDGRVWRVDVGMAKHYGGKPAVLEIVGDDVKIIAR